MLGVVDVWYDPASTLSLCTPLGDHPRPDGGPPSLPPSNKRPKRDEKVTSMRRFKEAMTRVGKTGLDGIYRGDRRTKKYWLAEDSDVGQYAVSVRNWLETSPEKAHLQVSDQSLDNAVNKAMHSLLDNAGMLEVRPSARHAPGRVPPCLDVAWGATDDDVSMFFVQ